MREVIFFASEPPLALMIKQRLNALDSQWILRLMSQSFTMRAQDGSLQTRVTPPRRFSQNWAVIPRFSHYHFLGSRRPQKRSVVIWPGGPGIPRSTGVPKQ